MEEVSGKITRGLHEREPPIQGLGQEISNSDGARTGGDSMEGSDI